MTVDLLRLPSLRVTGTYDEDGSLIVEAEGTVGIRHKCSLLCNLVKMGRAEPARFRDHAIQGQPTWIEVRRQRFKCKAQGCAKTPYEDLPDFDTDRHMTKRFRQHIEIDAVRLTFTKAADMNGVHETLVRRVFADYAERQLKDYQPKLPRVLGIDEKVLRGTACLVIGDVEKGRMLDMRPSRLDKDIRPYFSDMKGRKDVEVVCQDMWRGYRQITKDLFPNAVTVIDKFHVIRMADWAVEVVRKSLYTKVDKTERVNLKRTNKLLKLRFDRATGEQDAKLRKLFASYAPLQNAYVLREWFYEIYDCESRAEAEEAMTKWLSDVPESMRRPYKPLITAVGNWRPYMLNYFDHRYTNAYTERLNGLIDTMNREATGLTFDVLRAKALLKYGTMERKPVYARRPKRRGSENEMGFAKAWNFTPDREVIGYRQVGLGADLSTLDAALRAGTF